ncbi:MAG: DNA primase [Burkholderiales bacterium]|nr:DNA primase [Burkholderiales bacterium]
MIATLLDKLEGVRRTGPDRWFARCPAHDDRSASLSVRELDNDVILIHDFAGCSAAEIVAAVGLDLSDLFPSKRDTNVVTGVGDRRRRIPATDALRAVSLEADLVAICAGRLAVGYPLTDSERKRLLKAASRIGAAAIEAGCYA